MQIINIDSKFELTGSQIYFTDNILKNNWLFKDEHYFLHYVSQNIPIYLLSELSFNSLKMENKIYDNEDINQLTKKTKTHNRYQNVVTEYLSLYIYDGPHGIPEIYLCPEIALKMSIYDERLHYFIAYIIINQLAHAWLDNRIGGKYRDYGIKDEFYYWMDNACANEITLYYFMGYFSSYNTQTTLLSPNPMSHYTPIDAINFIRNFIIHQPLNYRLGFYFKDFGLNAYQAWRSNKHLIRDRTEKKQEWLDLIKDIFLVHPFENFRSQRHIFCELTADILNINNQ